jgi:hypothetical protein
MQTELLVSDVLYPVEAASETALAETALWLAFVLVNLFCFANRVQTFMNIRKGNMK